MRRRLKKKKKSRNLTDSLAKSAASTFNGELNDYIENVRKIHEQIIDTRQPRQGNCCGLGQRQ